MLARRNNGEGCQIQEFPDLTRRLCDWLFPPDSSSPHHILQPCCSHLPSGKSSHTCNFASNWRNQCWARLYLMRTPCKSSCQLGSGNYLCGKLCSYSGRCCSDTSPSRTTCSQNCRGYPGRCLNHNPCMRLILESFHISPSRNLCTSFANRCPGIYRPCIPCNWSRHFRFDTFQQCLRVWSMANGIGTKNISKST